MRRSDFFFLIKRIKLQLVVKEWTFIYFHKYNILIKIEPGVIKQEIIMRTSKVYFFFHI